MIEGCKYFSLIDETDDFALIRINSEEEFNGYSLKTCSAFVVMQLAQYLLDKHGLLHVEVAPNGVVLCRKIKEKRVD